MRKNKTENRIDKSILKDFRGVDRNQNPTRVQLIDRGIEYIDRYLVRVKGVVEYFSIHQEPANDYYNQAVKKAVK